VRFWDSSALVPLLTQEPSTPAIEQVLSADPHVAVWWGSLVECHAAIRRRQRVAAMRSEDVSRSLACLADLRSRWDEILPTGELRTRAIRLVGVHSLRASDAMQLSAALLATEGETLGLPFVCLDRRLAEAAEREGLEVVPAPRD